MHAKFNAMILCMFLIARDLLVMMKSDCCDDGGWIRKNSQNRNKFTIITPKRTNRH